MAGAGKSRFSKEARAGRARYTSKRRTDFRPPLPIIVIVCDDAKTAVRYFNRLKRLVKETVTLKVKRNPSDQATPMDVINCAINHISKLGGGNSNDDDDRDSVWALIDLEEADVRRQQALYAKEQGESAGIYVALSDPCYEMWTLLHLVSTGEMFHNCDAVKKRLETEWRKEFGKEFGPKAQANYSKILPTIAIAAQRAKEHKENDDQSWTEIYLLIEEIYRHA